MTDYDKIESHSWLRYRKYSYEYCCEICKAWYVKDDGEYLMAPNEHTVYAKIIYSCDEVILKNIL